MSYLSPSTTAGSQIPIGFPIVMPHGKSPTFTMGDGSIFMRSGLLVPPATYPKAALCEHLQVLGNPGTTTIVPGYVHYDICTDGGGLNYLFCYNDNTNNYYTNDGGLTWNTVAHGLAQGCTSVAYGNGQWLAAGTTATTRKISRSSTVNGTYTVVDNTGSLTNNNNSGKLCYTGGTNFVFVAQGTTSNNCAFSSNSGATWTSKSFATVFNNNSSLLAIAADGAGKVICCYSSSATPQYSTDYGATWQNGTCTTSGGGYYNAQYYNGLFHFATATGFDISANGSSISSSIVAPMGLDSGSAGTSSSLQLIGGKLCFLVSEISGYGKSLMIYDGTKFTVKQIRSSFYGLNALLCGSQTTGHAVFLFGSSTYTFASTPNINGIDYVGTTREQVVGYVGSDQKTAGYQYIKVADK